MKYFFGKIKVYDENKESYLVINRLIAAEEAKYAGAKLMHIAIDFFGETEEWSDRAVFDSIKEISEATAMELADGCLNLVEA